MINYTGCKMDLRDRSKWVAIIGSRNASQEERKTAYLYGKRMAERGFIIVSGLAKGIDASAHLGAIHGGGKTIALVSTLKGSPIYPPENKSLATQIENNGCIIYPFSTRAKYERTKFTQGQKRLIERSILNAYVCPHIVVVKDSEHEITGGTKWATKYGMDIGHEVYRLNSKFEFFKNPKVEDCRTSWIRELDIDKFLEELDIFNCK